MTWNLNVLLISSIITILFIQILHPINANPIGTKKHTFSRRLFGIVQDNKNIKLNCCINQNDYYNEQQQLIPKQRVCIRQHEKQYQQLHLNQNNDIISSISSILSVRGGDTGSNGGENTNEDDDDGDDDIEEYDNNDDNFSESESNDPIVETPKAKAKTIKRINDMQGNADNNNNIDNDCTTVVANMYNVPATRQEYVTKKVKKSKKKKNNKTNTILPILNGSFADALQIARTNGRLLLIVIPTTSSQESKASDSDTKTSDQRVMESFLSAEVTKLIESNVVGKQQQQKKNSIESPAVEQKSFVLWYTKPNSIDANIVVKQITGIQIKNPKTNKKRPILAVIYPNRVTSTNAIIPQLIGQYHCNPVPTIQTLVLWLQSIKVRCKKQLLYKNMYNELIENLYYQQRMDGYKGSITNDIQRIENEKILLQQQQELAKQKRLHTQRILQRRQQLKDSLPIEPLPTTTSSKLTKITTIALRFVDISIVSTIPMSSTSNTKKDTRRFNTDTTTLSDIFNWIDVQYEIERETIVLQSMKQNDNTKYTWITTKSNGTLNDVDDNDNDNDIDSSIMSKTLSELGFGKMIAFRVSIVQQKNN